MHGVVVAGSINGARLTDIGGLPTRTIDGKRVGIFGAGKARYHTRNVCDTTGITHRICGCSSRVVVREQVCNRVAAVGRFFVFRHGVASDGESLPRWSPPYSRLRLSG
jgi:hypothetical protein